MVPEIEGAPCVWLPRAVEEELAYQAQRVHWALGDGWDPQDVEWAWDGERLWLLQARPVTHVPRPGWAETAAMPRYWSRANLKDNQPGIYSDLSWSGLENVVLDALFGVMKLAGYRVPPGMQVVRRFHGRGYFDLTTMEYGFYDAFGIQPADIMKTIGGHQPQIDVPPKPLSGAAGWRRLKTTFCLLCMVWNHPRHAHAVAAKCIGTARRLAEFDWRGASLAEMAQGMVEVSLAEEAFIPVFALANASSGPWQLGLDGMLKDPVLVNRLQAGSGAVASAEHGYRLYEIASGKSTIEEFLREFGHRAVYETEVENPRWIEDPSWILQQVETIRAYPPERDPRDVAAEVRREAEREVRRRFPWRAPLILWEARKLRESSAAREGTKSAMVSMIWPVRRIALESARRLVEAGLLDRPEQIFRFTSADLRCFLRGWWDGNGARELACDRERTRERWLSEDCPEVITEAPDGAMVVESPALETPAAGAGWVGMAVSPGAAVGPARVVRNPGDAEHLLPGDVLCAPSTDPGWTPLFLRASAIVIETGGYLSHGSIVAREYGIPAVANVPGILDAVRDGERLKVDGSRGCVVRERQ